MPLSLHSPAFAPNGPIPPTHTCDRSNTAPELTWSGTPEGTRSFVLIVDDPDAPDPAAPKRTFVHWLLYDIAPTASGLPERGVAPPGARTGLNDEQHQGYTGPCPPIGRHRYFFKLYALDRMLGDLGAPRKEALERAMRGHVIAQAELIGTYERSSNGAKHG